LENKTKNKAGITTNSICFYVNQKPRNSKIMTNHFNLRCKTTNSVYTKSL